MLYLISFFDICNFAYSEFDARERHLLLSCFFYFHFLGPEVTIFGWNRGGYALLHLYSDWIWLRTRGWAMVATCQSQGIHTLKNTLQYLFIALFNGIE